MIRDYLYIRFSYFILIVYIISLKRYTCWLHLHKLRSNKTTEKFSPTLAARSKISLVWIHLRHGTSKLFQCFKIMIKASNSFIFSTIPMTNLPTRHVSIGPRANLESLWWSKWRRLNTMCLFDFEVFFNMEIYQIFGYFIDLSILSEASGKMA